MLQDYVFQNLDAEERAEIKAAAKHFLIMGLSIGWVTAILNAAIGDTVYLLMVLVSYLAHAFYFSWQDDHAERGSIVPDLTAGVLIGAWPILPLLLGYMHGWEQLYWLCPILCWGWSVRKIQRHAQKQPAKQTP